jgi:DNA-binding transcriptional regulator YiaG
VTGDELKQRRVEAGMSPGEFAREVGVSVQAVSAWEHSTRNIPPFRIAVIEQALKDGAVKTWDNTGVLVLSWH